VITSTNGRGQSPSPGFSEKWVSSLPVWPSNFSASGSGSFFCVMFGHASEY